MGSGEAASSMSASKAPSWGPIEARHHENQVLSLDLHTDRRDDPSQGYRAQMLCHPVGWRGYALADCLQSACVASAQVSADCNGVLLCTNLFSTVHHTTSNSILDNKIDQKEILLVVICQGIPCGVSSALHGWGSTDGVSRLLSADLAGASENPPPRRGKPAG